MQKYYFFTLSAVLLWVCNQALRHCSCKVMAMLNIQSNFGFNISDLRGGGAKLPFSYWLCWWSLTYNSVVWSYCQNEKTALNWLKDSVRDTKPSFYRSACPLNESDLNFLDFAVNVPFWTYQKFMGRSGCSCGPFWTAKCAVLDLAIGRFCPSWWPF